MRELWVKGDGLDDRVVYQGRRVWIGRFRCPRGDRRFGPWSEIDGHSVVFPRTSVYIEHEGSDALVADPNHVMFYNRGQVYRRTPISERGDMCEWFAVDTDTLVEAIRSYDPYVQDRHEAPLAMARGGCSRRTYAAQRFLYRHVCTADDIDDMLVEETTLLILQDVIETAYSQRGVRISEGEAPRRLEEAARFMNERYEDRLTLDAIAEGVGLSPFHLCRAFKKRMGVTVHQYLTGLRLRSSLERIGEGDLTSTALSLGFSSHSHFTDCFRREFGLTPSQFRAGADDLTSARTTLAS